MVWERRCDLSALREVLAAVALAPRVRRVVASFSVCSPRERLLGVVLVSVLGLQWLSNLKMIEIYAYGRFMSSKVDRPVRYVQSSSPQAGRTPARSGASQALFFTNPTVSCPHGFAMEARS